MSRREGMRTKKCGCVIYKIGPPVRCEKHANKEARKAAREKKKEEKGLRKLATEQAASLGHSLTQFREYPSVDGKWTAYCSDCGWMCIVYDYVPEASDQVLGRVLTEVCKRSELAAALSDVKEAE